MPVNQKLIPIFLQEAEVNLGILADFFLRCAQSSPTREDLKSAYRAAHTIKGTSQLVNFIGINQIALPIEKQLEKHYRLGTEIAQSECDILQQVVKLLAEIVARVKNAEPEPGQLIDRALTLLQQITPTTALTQAEPRQGESTDESSASPLVKGQPTTRPPTEDPFAEDEAFDLEGSFNSGVDSVGDGQPTGGHSHQFIPVDPFADDPDPSVFNEHPLALDPLTQAEPAADLNAPLSSAEGGHLDPSYPPDDPAAGLDQDDNLRSENATATDLLAALNLPEQDIEPRRDYVCCAFALGGRNYHLPIGNMVEIADIEPLLPLPLAPVYIKGLVNLRGQVMPAIDMTAFHPHEEALGETWRLVVAQHNDEKIAFLAEGIPYLSEDRIGDEIDLATFIEQHRLKGISA